MRWPPLLAGLAALCVLLGAGQVGAQSTLGKPDPTVATVTTNSLTVLWVAPSDDGGSAITAYDLRHIETAATAAEKAIDANWTLEENVWTTGGGAFIHEIKDLADGTQYDVQMRAVNANNPDGGPWSDTDAGTTTDYGGTTATATELTLGSSLPGSIDPADDEDIFEIELTSAADLWVYVTGDLDTVGELLDSNGALLEENDDGTLLDSPLGFSLRSEIMAGTYYVRVSSFKDRAAGSYTIHAQTVTDPGDTRATATTVTLDSATPGRIGPVGGDPDDPDDPGDVDYFKLELKATTDVWVMAYGDLDTFGELYGQGQNPIATYDDSDFVGNETGFMFRRQLQAGTYYIGVTGFFADDIGPYTLHVRTATEPGSTTATAAPLTLRVPETGRISSASDRDYFSLTLAEDTYVFIYALTFGSALPLTPTIRNDQGTRIPMHVIPHANWAEQGMSEISFSVWGKIEAGTYQVSIGSAGGSTGTYLLDPLVSTYGRMLEECTALTTPQSDPWYGCQWHLNNTGQFDGGARQDINVESVWSGGNMGEGINVAVVDDGLEFDHEDLSANVLTARNHDYARQGGVYDPLETHGTAVAGLIAARDNDIGVRGVAPRAKVFSYNVIARSSSVSDSEASAMYRSEDAQHTAISNNSWGFGDRGYPRRSSATWRSAVERGVTEGYGKKGILYVWAAGNGHLDGDNSNLDGRANFYAVTAACAVGYDDKRSRYSEMGANLWVCAPSNSRRGLPQITTTHIPDRYRDNFGGTSSAAPIVSGVAALVRAANTDLTWRDVKLILAASARRNDPGNSGWEQGAVEYGSTTNDRYWFNHEYGFGMVDAAAAVALAESWSPDDLPDWREIEAESGTLDREIPDALLLGTPSTITSSLTLDPHVEFVEFMEIELELDHDRFRNLQIELESPAGAVSVLSVPATLVLSSRSSRNHIPLFVDVEATLRFGSARHLGEDAAGTWTLHVSDRKNEGTGTLKSWTLKAYGHGYTPGHVDIDDVVPGPGALTVSWKPPDDIGGSAVTRYDLRHIRADATDPNRWTEVTDVGSVTDRQYTLSGLAGEAKYFLSMRAVNDAGVGPWSQPYDEETERVLPGPPRSVSVAARNNGLAISWREPAYLGVGITAYDVRYIREDAADKADIFWTERNFAWRTGDGDLRSVIRGPQNGVRYEVQVRGRNSRGDEGEWSGVARGTPAETNSPAEFPDSDTGQRTVPENTPAGVNIGEPVAARDDEGDTLTYSLSSGGANFDIVETTGQLQTKVPLDRERTSSYAVTVAVHDGKASDGTASTTTDDTIRVTITIENVDEPPAITGATDPTVRENNTAVTTYRASDPERATSTFTWSLTGDDAGAFTISERRVLTFDPAPDFEGPTDSFPLNVYEVTIRATDESAVDQNARTGELPVRVTVEDVPEPPVVMGEEHFTRGEGPATFVGNYRATDPEGADTTWVTLAGPDARHFVIDEFGDLSFTAPPDFDARADANRDNTYEVTVRASDDRNLIGSLNVTVIVTNVNEPPVVTGLATIEVNEGQTGTVATYSRRDPEGQSTNWGRLGQTAALTGPDANRFEFDKQTGRLTFAAPPDFETGGAQYELTLNANDGSLNGRLDVTVNVNNVDEPEGLTLDRRQPVIDRPVTPTLTEVDNVASTTWSWERSRSRGSGWTAIGGATGRTYIPTGDDRDHYLRVTAQYDDGHGSDKSLRAVTDFPAADDRVSNASPVFPDTVAPISVREDTPAGRNVGSPVRATDAENDALLYTLSGSSDFAIGRTNGQIRVADRVEFDYEGGQRSYTVLVKADDGFAGGTGTVDVTITITDVNEPPVVEDDTATTNEDEAVVINVLSDDRDPETANADLTVSVSRPQNGGATLDAVARAVTYTPKVNYHGADSFTYTVSDGNRSTLGTVSVAIRSVNDAPTFAAATAERTVVQTAQPGANVGAPVTARDVDSAVLAYRLTGASEFEIVEDTAQITVAAGATFDAAIQDTYTVVVEASDSNPVNPLVATVTVTITVTTRPPPPPIIFGGGFGGGGGGPSGPTPSEADFEWTVERDIEELDGGHDKPSGTWSDGATLWVLENGDGADDAIYAYDLESGERLEDREFELDETNRAPRGVWSDRTVIWVSDSGRNRLFAHNLASGERLPERDIALAERNRAARGIWSDDETMFVLDGGKDSLFAYDLASGELLAEYALDPANDDPQGIWSDRVTVWVSNHDPKGLFAYRLPAPEGPAADDAERQNLERVRDEEFPNTILSRASNNSPRGIWSDGAVMYVADESDARVYTYNMPDAIDARLASLTLSGVDIGEFDSAVDEYPGIPDDGVAETTVVAEAVQDGATVSIAPSDADGDIGNGHQVSVESDTAITVTVMSADRSRNRVYRVAVDVPLEVLQLNPTWNSLEWPGVGGVAVGGALEDGGIADKIAVIYEWDGAGRTWRVFFPGLEDVPGLNTLAVFRQGHSYWIAVAEPVTWTVAAGAGDAP